MLKLKHIALLLSVFTLMWSGLVASSEPEPKYTWHYDFQDAIWPLCGHVAENYDDETIEDWGTADCPEDQWDENDLPLSATFGSRIKGGEGGRYDYHRGIDIPVIILEDEDEDDEDEDDENSQNQNQNNADNDNKVPVFAISDGKVYRVYKHSLSEPNGAWVRIRHKREDASGCSNYGCYYSTYMHMDKGYIAGEDGEFGNEDDLLKKDDQVVKGQFIGYVNMDYENSNGNPFPHLHFEIRNAPVNDPFSAWQRDAIHPLRVLPYSPEDPEITLDVDVYENEVTVEVETKRVDVVRVELTLFDDENEITQPGNTENDKGYNVNPSWFDMEKWNFQYSHKNGGSYLWSSFWGGGHNECPFYDDDDNGPHPDPSEYDPNVHLDRQYKDDDDVVHKSVGQFNGVRIAPEKYNADTDDYTLTLTFEELTGLELTDCIEVEVSFATGDSESGEWCL